MAFVLILIFVQWLVEREERVRNAQALFEANQREIARLQGFVDRFGAKTMGASMAQSRLKTIEKLEASGVEAPPVRLYSFSIILCR